MDSIESLTPDEWARQLGNPKGEIGLAVVEKVYESNSKSSVQAVATLGLHPNDHVLEVGFGNGRMVPEVLKQAEGLRYAGLDLSPTMVAEAERFNGALVTAGQASFYLGSAEHMPFPDRLFNCIFSIGVAHFWSTPSLALSESFRVLRPGGLSMIGCLHPRTAPPFARPDNGFYLRDAAEWEALHRAAGFVHVQVEEVKTQQINAAGTPVERYIFKIVAHS